MKRALILGMATGLIFTGCVKSNDSSQDSIANTSKSSMKTDLTADKTKVNVADEKALNNQFFFTKGVSQMDYDGNFLFYDSVKKEAKLNITEVSKLKYGKLYELKLDPVEGIPDSRLSLGYFYVQEDKIYKINATKEDIGKFKVDEELPDGSAVVCQDKEMKDTLDPDEPGWHHYIEANGDKRIYHSYSNKVETGYYESFTWEKNKGLVNYRSGYGSERDSIELQLSEPVSNQADYTYTFSGGRATITGYTGSGRNISIPATISDSSGKYSVTAIGESAFFGRDDLKSVRIPDSVKSIGNSAFAECRNLTNVTIPDGVTYIDSGAFASCSSLKSIKLPDSLTAISGGLFFRCNSLASIDIPENVLSIDYWAFSGCSSLNVINAHPMAAPAINTEEDVFGNVPSSAVLYIHEGATGYDVSPWSYFEQRIFAE